MHYRVFFGGTVGEGMGVRGLNEIGGDFRDGGAITGFDIGETVVGEYGGMDGRSTGRSIPFVVVRQVFE